MEKKQKQVYYAHSMLIYDTRREKKELKFLKKHYKFVCNPNTDIKWDDAMEMEPYFKAIKSCDLLICSEYKNHIGKGVYDEIRTALNNNIIVLCLKKKLFRYRLHNIKDLILKNENDWKIKYGKINTHQLKKEM